ncbi:MAG: hypothetical protein NT066_03415 [Candidatus Omnitrophica bacterium]|nr:hypothetical protein [Candidatus Omnitrophota bacterium]
MLCEKMNKKKLIFTWVMLIFVSIGTSGCALIGTAISAGMAYGIYQATRK